MLWLVRALYSILFPPGDSSSSCTCSFGVVLLSASGLMLAAQAEIGPWVSEPEEKLGHGQCSVSRRQVKLLFTAKTQLSLGQSPCFSCTGVSIST